MCEHHGGLRPVRPKKEQILNCIKILKEAVEFCFDESSEQSKPITRTIVFATTQAGGCYVQTPQAFPTELAPGDLVTFQNSSKSVIKIWKLSPLFDLKEINVHPGKSPTLMANDGLNIGQHYEFDYECSVGGTGGGGKFIIVNPPNADN